MNIKKRLISKDFVKFNGLTFISVVCLKTTVHNDGMKKNTEALCPVCRRRLPAEKTRKGFEVFLTRVCPEHGLFETKISKDADRFFDKTFSVKGKPFTPSVSQKTGKCPDDCGWCDRHEQHICTGLIEVTDVCNMACPVCYFGDKGANHISVEEFGRRLETLLAVENGSLDVLQISGGECTLHPDFDRLVETAVRAGVGRVLINTNGLKLAEDGVVLETVLRHKDKVEVYLQYDGADDDVYADLRGRAMAGLKQRVLDRLEERDVKVCLAATVYRKNLKDLPDILRTACRRSNVTGVTFQRLEKTGAARESDLESVLQEDILHALAQSGLMEYKDLIPLPCSHENCTSLGFLFCTSDRIYSLGDYVDFTKCKETISNRIAFDKTVLDYMKKNVCKCFVGKVLGDRFLLDRLQQFASAGEGASYRDMKIVRIIVKNFMDAQTFDFERARKCCVGVSVGGGKVIPFCLYNNLKGMLP